MAKLNVYIVSHNGNAHGKQSLMIISSFSSCVPLCWHNSECPWDRVRLYTKYNVQRGCRDNTILNRQKRLLSFQNEHFLYFLTVKAYWFDQWSLLDTVIMWKATSRKQVTNRRFIAVFSLVNAFNRIWNWLKVFRCKLKDFNRMTRGKQHNNRCNCISNNSLRDTNLNYP